MGNISLDGIEITVIKALGIGASPMLGKDLAAKVTSIPFKEFLGVLKGLVDTGLVSADSDFDGKKDTLEKNSFFVNPGYADEIEEILDPEPKERNKRVRRQ